MGWRWGGSFIMGTPEVPLYNMCHIYVISCATDNHDEQGVAHLLWVVEARGTHTSSENVHLTLCHVIFSSSNHTMIFQNFIWNASKTAIDAAICAYLADTISRRSLVEHLRPMKPSSLSNRHLSNKDPHSYNVTLQAWTKITIIELNLNFMFRVLRLRPHLYT